MCVCMYLRIGIREKDDTIVWSISPKSEESVLGKMYNAWLYLILREDKGHK